VGGLQGLSTDFITDNNYLLLRFALDLLSKTNKGVTDNQAKFPIGISQQLVNVPLLYNIPIERVLELALLEPDRFESFKSSLRQQLLSIDTPAGSVERDRQLYEINSKMEKDVTDLTLALKSSQRKLSQKFAVYTSLSAFSIVTAGLSTIGHNLDTLSIIGAITAGTGFSASIKEFAKEWLVYQDEIENLRSNPNYFIWKLQKHKR
jgi:hypothetical protein